MASFIWYNIPQKLDHFLKTDSVICYKGKIIQKGGLTYGQYQKELFISF
ncbi:MAG: hypothetical protein QG588_1299 [Candidatus Poribacteria bacterium]|nr:hypothetical protein [Candidatus Poribacteria bacterium]